MANTLNSGTLYTVWSRQRDYGCSATKSSPGTTDRVMASLFAGAADRKQRERERCNKHLWLDSVQRVCGYVACTWTTRLHPWWLFFSHEHELVHLSLYVKMINRVSEMIWTSTCIVYLPTPPLHLCIYISRERSEQRCLLSGPSDTAWFLAWLTT